MKEIDKGSTSTSSNSPPSSSSGRVGGGSSRVQKRFLHNFGRYSSTYQNPIALWAEKWWRRTISITMISIVFILLSILYPILAIVALAFDLFLYRKRGGLNYVRVLSFFECYLFIQIIAMICSFLIWVVYLITLIVDFDRDGSRFQSWSYWYQDWWGGTMLFGWSTAVLGLKVEVELEGKNGFKSMFSHDTRIKLAKTLGINPKLIFLRHASFADTLVPQGIFSYLFHMRYIVKKELLWDPGLDVSGSRTPNFFLFRDAGTEGMDVEMEAVKALVTDFKPKNNDVTCIWPEGTRFTKGKREKVLESLKKKGDTKSYEFASKLKHTLLPRVGGFLSLLESNPCGDVIFVSHFGLEASSNFASMMKGELCNRIVKIKFTQVKYADIPATKAERIEWLHRQWVAIDNWVGEQEEQFQKEKKLKKVKSN